MKKNIIFQDIKKNLITPENLNEKKQNINLLIEEHRKWLDGRGGKRADFRTIQPLQGYGFVGYDFKGINLSYAVFKGVNLTRANFCRAILREADFEGCNMKEVMFNLADLRKAQLRRTDLSWAIFRGANLKGADVENAKGLIKVMGVEHLNYYWKRLDKRLMYNGYCFKPGINELSNGEFERDERITWPLSTFVFGSRSWNALNLSSFSVEALIRIPEDALINEPWATEGQASANKIIVEKLFDAETGNDITANYS